jgi:hypothetical protein
MKGFDPSKLKQESLNKGDQESQAPSGGNDWIKPLGYYIAFGWLFSGRPNPLKIGMANIMEIIFWPFTLLGQCAKNLF